MSQNGRSSSSHRADMKSSSSLVAGSVMTAPTSTWSNSLTNSRSFDENMRAEKSKRGSRRPRGTRRGANTPTRLASAAARAAAWPLPIALLLLLITATTSVGARGGGGAPTIPASSLARFPRGGGWFGGRGNGSRRGGGGGRNGGNGGGGGGGGDPNRPKMYPALTRSEIEEKLNIPVFGITDPDGRGVAVGRREASDGEECFVHFFLSRPMAEGVLRRIRDANDGVELKLCAFHLGKIWYRLLHRDDDDSSLPELLGRRPGEDEYGPPPASMKNVTFRLVPGIRDLVGARLLATLNPDEARRLKDAIESTDKESAAAIIHRASESSTVFTAPHDEIPLFVMPQMRVMQRPSSEDTTGGPPTGQPKLPFFFGAKNMVEAYLTKMRESPDGFDPTVPPVVQLVELNHLVRLMQSESDFDFRSIVLFPPVNEDEGAVDFDDDSDDEDDDDDDGGGDGSIARKEEEPQIDVQVECTPFFSTAEVGLYGAPVDGQRGEQHLVPM